MSEPEYLRLLEWTARQRRGDNRGVTPPEIPELLTRLGINGAFWMKLTGGFGRLFGVVAGRCDRVSAFRGHKLGRHFYLRRQAKELLPRPG